MKQTVICYKTKEPVYYNKGTKDERQCDQFLAYYTTKTKEEAQTECNELNNHHYEKLWNNEKIDWNKIEYFFTDEQEEMR